ncbi:YkgJ family cysteine cluster protein [Ralstonia pseudosolanacearum]|uniref:YkgJ family cysteine cluster protein n=1 Tax=Ralstonia pseudosolanacearum TaxID=1310165 RepID=UPI000A7FD3F4|nr:YkgJ family cysteine cluster protein [Ralstonia pseudosolanacearum]
MDEIIDDEMPQAMRAFDAVAPGRFRSAVIQIYRKLDSDLASASTHVACQEGCSYCCYYRVEVTAAEALALAEHVAVLPPEAKMRTATRLRETASQVSTLTREQYEATNIRCAFLEGDRCSVYELRPVACRGHHSLSAAVCKDAFVDPTSASMSPIDPFRNDTYLAYKSVMAVGQSVAGRDSVLYEMHGAVTEALANPAAARRWRAGKVSFPPVTDRRTLSQAVSDAMHR